MSQPDLFGPCELSLAIRHAVRTNGTDPVKTCTCTSPCWWRKGGMRPANSAEEAAA